MKNKNTITLTDAEVVLLLSATIFAGSVDVSANWGKNTDAKFVKLAKNISKQTGVNDVSEFLSADLDVEDDRMLDDPKTFRALRPLFTFGE